MQKLLKIPLALNNDTHEPTLYPAITYYAENSTWNIRLGRFRLSGIEPEKHTPKDLYQAVKSLEWDWERKVCREKFVKTDSTSMKYAPETLIDIREILGCQVLAEGRRIATVVDGVISEEDFCIDHFIISLVNQMKETILIAAEWCSWLPRPQQSMELIIPQNELRRMLMEHSSSLKQTEERSD